MIYLHTITGSARDTADYTRQAVKRGWRACVFTRRGHSRLPLTVPRHRNYNRAKLLTVLQLQRDG